MLEIVSGSHEGILALSGERVVAEGFTLPFYHGMCGWSAIYGCKYFAKRSFPGKAPKKFFSDISMKCGKNAIKSNVNI